MRSRKLKSDVNYIYCRKCKEEKTEDKFYSATDTFLVSNGFFSICKSCCGEIFKNKLNSETDIKKAIYQTCKILNVAYIPDAIDSAILQLESKKEDGKEGNIDSLWGIYKSKIGQFFRVSKSISQTFEPSIGNEFNKEDEQIIIEQEGEDFSLYLNRTWGKGLSIEDYEFLESELANWKQSHKCDTYSELKLMILICHSQLDIRKAREEGGDTKTLIKSYQELIKTSNLSPAQADMTQAGKANETYGMWIKDIENLTPAEYWKDNKIFADVDGLKKYFDDYFLRSIRNFITGSRDFIVTEDLSPSEEEDAETLDNPVSYEIKEED
jgi:hypothetical protein